MRRLLFAVFFVMSYNIGYTQSAPNGSYNFNSGDPALAYNKYSILKGENETVQIGAFKVIGSPYLLGIKHPANVYGKKGVANSVFAGYDTYRQEVEVYLDQSNSSFKKNFHEIDSFTLLTNPETDSLHFVNFFDKGFKEKVFLQVVKDGKKIELLKTFKSELGATSNYVQSDLRQFDLDITYYSYDKLEMKFSKLKLSKKDLKQKFPQAKELIEAEDDNNLKDNPEQFLKSLFNFLNS